MKEKIEGEWNPDDDQDDDTVGPYDRTEDVCEPCGCDYCECDICDSVQCDCCDCGDDL